MAQQRLQGDPLLGTADGELGAFAFPADARHAEDEDAEWRD